MKNLTIGKRIIISVAVLCAALLGVGYFAGARLSGLNVLTQEIVNDSMPGILIFGRVNVRQAENQLRVARLLRAKTPEDRERIKKEITELVAANSEDLKQYEATIFEDEDKRLYETFAAARKTNTEARSRFFELIESDPVQAAAYVETAVVPAYTAYSKAGDALLKYNANQGVAVAKKINEDVVSSIRLLTITLIIALAAGIILSAFNIRSILKVLSGVSDNLHAGAQQTTAAATQVSTASQSLAQGATEQAASLEETSASLEEISSMTKRNAENAQRAKDLAGHARQAADTGVTDMTAMKTAMSEIKGSSDDIAKIIKTIDEIAFQTNILALNAAVEAARAGEAGAGFAVVADEVRNLAQRAAQAAKETAAKIETAIDKTHQGVEISNKVAVSLEAIVTRTREVNELVVEIASASLEQNQGISQVTQAVAQMDQVTQSNAASAEESASAAEELNAQAHALEGVVSELLTLTGQTSAATTATAAPSAQHVHKPAAIAKAKTAPATHTVQASHSPEKPAATKQADHGDFFST